ncbi:adenosylcobalamin-dependent ribonucleoside-diphosphate reductase [Geotoga petraea]|jgi:ribonucleoside-diphosphate reductase alpha chain|uniref:Vitamin B12-dependent ribonucleotide reductase n=1 Tax=Geotoga petraea TaxID=28234 RepID=A0A1G6JE14_9BACT|nr:adenosylcobalamin-dependent ribonucleoside-diphosphate reductase [Geotoga petraea]TGG88198.1 adenosylcobalamin-dependent ribonucleoside-diphosphate reductase [Geotoga petraea]SDC16950.1 ribonucleoside-diphosphate reductase class II [Geotoga petraea]
MERVINKYLNVKPSKNANTILKDRYLMKDGQGRYLEETWDDVSKRVARHVASAEVKYTKDVKEIQEIEKKYYNMIKSRIFLPNSPTIFNSGKAMPLELFKKEAKDMGFDDYKKIFDSKSKHNMLSACFVVPMDDSMDGIFEAVKQSAMIMKYGGGVGYDFSVLRPKGTSIAGTGGKSSGPISFMHVFNTSASTIEQGGARRAAQMAVMKYDHPDVLDFINSKKDNDGNSVLNYFNISINIDDVNNFKNKLKNDEEITLEHPESDKTAKLNAKEYLRKISENAWKSGDPGLLFLGKHNHYYAMGHETPVQATNPCGEEPLPPFGSCNLGSIDIAKLIDFVDIGNPKDRNLDIFEDIVYWASRFLDDVIDMNVYPLPQIDEISKNQRFIGLGIMGLADALYKKSLAYNSVEGRKFMAKVTASLAYFSHVASSKLAEKRGNFPDFKKSKYPKGFIPMPLLEDDFDEDIKLWNQKLRDHFLNTAIKYKRNVQTNTVAPTGSISNLADTSSGIEPNFMLAYIRYMTDKEGNRVPLPYINSILVDKMGDDLTEDLEAEIIEQGSLTNIKNVSDEYKKIFVTSMDISAEDHLLAQHVIQSYLDASCSKTINMKKEITVDEVYNIYEKALDLNIKGITIYRDGSLQTQVLEKNKDKKEDKKVTFFVLDEKHKLRARPRKETLRSVTRKFKFDDSTIYITLSFDDNGEAIEVFLSDGTETTEIIGRLSSIALRAGVSSDEIIEQLKKVKGGYCKNLAEEVKKAIEDFAELWKEEVDSYEVYKTGKPKTKEEIEKFVHVNDLKYEKGVYIDSEGNTYCPSCLNKNSLIMESGCTSCKTCGWSKCS